MEGDPFLWRLVDKNHALPDGYEPDDLDERNVRESGQETADRESSQPGHSQHQLGLAVDFGSITDAFAGTAAGRWILVNGPKYGWSLSFPDGYEHLTGYRWESWHYLYTGTALAALIDKWFGGIQQYALQFIHAWQNNP
jgi:D-alanyl-D-alanine carboxypeptidase